MGAEAQTRIRQGLAALGYKSEGALEAELATRTSRRGNVQDQMSSCVEWLARQQRDGDTVGDSATDSMGSESSTDYSFIDLT